MADFRKLVLALAVLALIAVPASAQNVMQCSAIAGAGTPIVRGEGLTELVGDTVLSCVGQGTTANIQVFLNTNVTNERAGSDLTDVILTVDGLNAGNAGNSGIGRLVGANSILWTGVTLPTAVGGTTAVIRITNVRANATQAPSAASGIPGQIVEFVSVTTVAPGTVPVSVFPSQLTVAAVAPGLTFAVNKDTKFTTFQQCTGLNTGVDTAEEAAGATNKFRLDFTEGIVNAFKTKTEEGPDATQGTRLFARFTNVPTGASIWVSPTQTNATTGTPAVPTAVWVTADAGVATGTPADVWQKVDLTGGAGTAVWEVTSDSQIGNPETLSFDVAVVFPANVSFTGGTSITAQVAGGFAPISTVGTSSETAAIPRFIDTSSPSDLFNITACVTNLLFPYVTNAAGFDTGIAIVNTSKDTGVFAKNTTPQSGTCNVYYFGTMGNGSQVPGPQTTATIAGGEMTAFLLSQGGVSGATNSAASFTGYVIARCNFQFAHGFAFISDLGGSKLAQGYLALVIPDATRKADPFTAAGSNKGEQLGM